MTSASPHRSGLQGRSRLTGSHGFTILELLTVMGVILVLLGIIIPTISSGQASANKAKARTQFSQWGAAFENFRQEYGVYPTFAAAAQSKMVNPTGTSTAITGNHPFHDILAGKHRDGSVLPTQTGNATPPAPVQQNPRRISFYNFTDSDFVLTADVNAGRATNAQLNFIRDAFFNTSIAVVTDSDLNGVINSRDATGGYPTVTVASGTTTIRPTTVVTTAATGGIHAGVIFYSAPPGATTENDLIMSWR